MKRTADTTRTALRSLSAMGPTVVLLARMQAKRTGKAVIYITQHGASAVLPTPRYVHTVWPYPSVLDAQSELTELGWDYEMLEATK